MTATTKKRGGLKGFIQLVTIGLAVAAVVKELRTPQEQRTWNGKVASVVPYDFRMPTIERAKERLWNPESEKLIGPRVFGVGWSPNFGRLFELGKAQVEKLTAK